MLVVLRRQVKWRLLPVEQVLVSGRPLNQLRTRANKSGAMDMWRKAGTAHISDASLAAQAATPIGKKLKRLRIASAVVAGILGVTVLSGGFVAGNDAGRAYNDFPLMAGEWIPEGIWNSDLGIRNVFENTATVQFDHRILAFWPGPVAGERRRDWGKPIQERRIQKD